MVNKSGLGQNSQCYLFIHFRVLLICFCSAPIDLYALQQRKRADLEAGVKAPNTENSATSSQHTHDANKNSKSKEATS